jgi:hypothetical protein
MGHGDVAKTESMVGGANRARTNGLVVWIGPRPYYHDLLRDT